MGLERGLPWDVREGITPYPSLELPSPRQKQRELSQRLSSNDSISHFSLLPHWAGSALPQHSSTCHVIEVLLTPVRGFGRHMGICSPWFLLSLEQVHDLSFLGGEARCLSALGNAGAAAGSPFALLPFFQILSRSRGSRQQ